MSGEERWMLPLAGFLMCMFLGVIYSWSVLRIPVETELGWGPAMSSLPFAIFLLTFSIFTPVSGRLTREMGYRWASIMGSLICGLGWLIASLAVVAPWSLLLSASVAGAGTGILYLIPFAVVGRRMGDYRGLGVGVVAMGFGISPVIFAPLIRLMIAKAGLSATFLWLGTVEIVGLPLLSSILTSLDQGEQIPSAGTREILRRREFWLLWVSLALGTVGGLLAISLSAKYGEEVVGLDPSAASLATSLFAVLNGAGGPVLGLVCDRAGVKSGAAASFLLSAISAVLASKAGSLPLYLLSFSLLWFTFGSWFAIFPLATSEFLSPEDFDHAYGLVFTAYGSGALLSLAMNYVGMSWSFSDAFLAILAFSLAGLLIFLRLGRKSSNISAGDVRMEPRGVAAKHSGLWSPRRRFESGRGYQ